MVIKLSTARLLATLGWLLCLLPVTAGAATAHDLFETEVPVSDQQTAARTQAMKTALAEVLVRVTGQRDLMQQTAARSLLDKPTRFVQQYRYFTVPDSVPPRLMLRVRYDGEAIRQALRQLGVAYWGGAERPDTLVWLAVEDRGARYIVSAQDNSDVYRQIERAARQRGIPLLFPLMDLEDQARVRFSDIWGGFFEHALAASERYAPQAVLIGRLNRSRSGSWVARWHMQVAGSPATWTDSDIQLQRLLQAGIDDIADTLASRLAVTHTEFNASATAITVEGITTLAAYARVNDYLDSLTAVQQFQVELVTDTTVQYRLQLTGTLQGLTQTITIGTVLEPAPAGMPGTYRLRQ